MKLKLKIWEMSLIVALVVTIFCGFMFENDAKELSEKLIRLHVVANSDSDADQSLKLDVRDEVLAVLSEILAESSDKAEAQSLIDANISQIISAAESEIAAQGYAYTVTAEITVEDFPTRDYDTFSLPAGEYTSLRIKIGEADGQNWWCVVYPAICTPGAMDESDDAVMTLSDDEISLITMKDSGYKFKFKTIEIINTILSWFK